MTQKINLNEARAIIDWVNLNDDIRELSLKCGDLELFISRNTHTGAPHPSPVPAASQAPLAAPTPPTSISPAPALSSTPEATTPTPQRKNELNVAADEIVIRAPMVGTFYTAPKPGAANFVAVGDSVHEQSVLCIVEVMKLMNNIEAGVKGVVQQILVNNEQAVEYNQPLMVIKLQS